MKESIVAMDGALAKSVASAKRGLRGLLLAPINERPRKKPATVPPALVIWISAVQHVGVIAIFMVYPLIVARQAGLPPDQITNLLQLAMLAMAAAVVAQALPRGAVGSRFLAPSIFTGVYFAPSLLAAAAGGLPLVWGMTIFAGIVEAALACVWSRLRPLSRRNRPASSFFLSA
jgi:NCS2 family nucleobase:cation symporter-2